MNVREYVKEGQVFVAIKDGNFEVVLCDLGASIFSITLDGRYMTQTPVEEKDFVVLRAFAGKTVGRSANRIKGNIITIEGKEYKLEDNEKGNTLHGGVNGLSTKTFETEIVDDKESAKVIYTYVSPDGESGFPGNLKVIVTYTVFTGQKELRMDYYATTDKTTCCYLANHAYYAVGEPSLKDTQLMINASHYLHCNPVDLLPIEKREVTDILDFRKFKYIMKDIDEPVLRNSKANGYDLHYYFDDNDINSLKAVLMGKEYKMSIYTDFSGLQIYSCNHYSPVPMRDLDIAMHNSIALEPQDDFIKPRLLRPNEEYRRFVRFVFAKV